MKVQRTARLDGVVQPAMASLSLYSQATSPEGGASEDAEIHAITSCIKVFRGVDVKVQ